MALAPLTYCSIHSITPSIIITNDWPCGLVATFLSFLFFYFIDMLDYIILLHL